MQVRAPIVKDLVLLGGGHSHVIVLKAFGMRPIEGVRVTLINRDVDTPYSGMLPGLIAGHYSFDETHIDLNRLSRFAGVRFLHDEVTGIEPDRNRLLFRNRPPVSYDVVSIDTGSTPNVANVPGAADFTVPVKPIANFLTRWEALCARALAAKGPLRIAVAGAGAGGIELMLAAQHRLQALRREAGISAPVEFAVFSAATEILPAFNPRTRGIFERVLRERGVAMHTGKRVARVEEGALVLEDGARHAADEILWVTDASAPAWLGAGGLAVDERGFVKVNASLQSLSHDNVFAAGDVAAVVDHPRPKAGVFAVRQGPPLTANLRRALLGQTLQPFTPQKEFLKLVSTGDKHAIAARNGLAIEGDWVWRWKDWIDRRFMAKFIELPPMDTTRPAKPFATLPGTGRFTAEAMRCGGCGAKIGSDVLRAVLRDLRVLRSEDVAGGEGFSDDAAIVRPPAGKVLVQTVDSFRAMIEDPYLFGKIAANHALGDIYAMGAKPHTALAIVTLPYSAPAKIEADLRQVMAGAVGVLNSAGAALVGGHTAEGAELTMGFSIQGAGEEAALLRKSGLQPGDAIVLTKPLGTGVLFAADMQHGARGRWIEAAIQSMLLDNAPAAAIFLEHGAHACTDVTGFGLAGHLGEMAQASGVEIAIDAPSLPLLEGAGELLKQGIASTLQDQNAHAALALFASACTARAAALPILFDPQTAGGLVAGVPAANAQACVAALREAGYRDACIAGTVRDRRDGGAFLSLQ
ncbi:MAG: selenide, water dikinase SelD [Beijerinckiaceae bacterium]